MALRPAQPARRRRAGDRRGGSQRPRAAVPAARGVGVTVAPVTTAFCVFFGRGGPSEIERGWTPSRSRSGPSSSRAPARPGSARCSAVTGDGEARAAFAGAGADVVAPRTDPFHFGEELLGLSRTRGLERLATIGAGAGALMSTAELRGCGRRSTRAKRSCCRTTTTPPTSSPSRRRRPSPSSIFRRRTIRCRAGCTSRADFPHGSWTDPRRPSSTSIRRPTPRC